MTICIGASIFQTKYTAGEYIRERDKNANSPFNALLCWAAPCAKLICSCSLSSEDISTTTHGSKVRMAKGTAREHFAICHLRSFQRLSRIRHDFLYLIDGGPDERAGGRLFNLEGLHKD